jgi:hypothetical protein
MPIVHRSTVYAGRMIVLLAIALSAPALAASPGAAAPARPTATAVAQTCAASTITLYDAALGGTPDTQGMLYQTIALSATQTFSNGVTILDTTPRRGDSAGYFGNSARVPALDRTSGYTLTFEVQVESEDHGSNNNRAGLSVIALSSDTRGIELGFWADHVWAQEGGTTNLFTHAEDTSFATTTGLISYTLAIRGDSYSLAANGSPILTGALRDYSAFVGVPDVYEIPNFIFIGDDTGSARARIRLAALAVAVPKCAHYQYLPLVIGAS